MVSRIISLFLFAVVLPIMESSLHSQELKQVQTDGVSVIEEKNVAKAKESAINDALKKAVEQTIASFIPSQTMIDNYQLMNERIYSRVLDFTKSYKILSAETDGSLMKVRINVEVSKDLIRNVLSDIGLLNIKRKSPKVLVMIVEQVFDKKMPGWWESPPDTGALTGSFSESALKNILEEKGSSLINSADVVVKISSDPSFKNTPLSIESAVKAGVLAGADIVIFGSAEVKKGEDVEESILHAAYSQITAEAVYVNSSRVIAAEKKSAAGIHRDENIAANNALKKACENLGTVIGDKIQAFWEKDVLNYRTILITLLKHRNYADVQRIKEAIRKIENVIDVHASIFTPDSTEIEVTVEGVEASLLATRIVDAMDPLKIKIKRITQDRIALIIEEQVNQ